MALYIINLWLPSLYKMLLALAMAKSHFSLFCGHEGHVIVFVCAHIYTCVLYNPSSLSLLWLWRLTECICMCTCICICTCIAPALFCGYKGHLNVFACVHTSARVHWCNFQHENHNCSEADTPALGEKRRKRRKWKKF